MTQVASIARTGVDTSPAAIAARRLAAAYARQDLAAELLRGGVKPMAAAQRLEVDKRLYHPMASCSAIRGKLRAAIAERTVEPPELTKPELLLLSSLLEAHHELLQRNETHNPFTWRVGHIAKRGKTWAVSAANKRLGVRYFHERSGDVSPTLQLVQTSGNGYVGLSDEGWRVCAALWPDRIAL